MAMPDVFDEMFDYAQTYIKNNSKYSPVVLKDTPPNNKFPLIIIKQIRDEIYDENLDKTDQRFYLGYEIEIYSTNIKNNVKQIITRELEKLVNDVFDEYYGMDRKMNRQTPNVDNNVYRWSMRYEAKIDENKKIYRR